MEWKKASSRVDHGQQKMIWISTILDDGKIDQTFDVPELCVVNSFCELVFII